MPSTGSSKFSLQALLAACGVAACLVAALNAAAPSTIALTQLSQDPFTNSLSQHKTEVEPDSFAHSSTMVAAFQVGRVFSGGSADIGFATSTDGGSTWTKGFLPGITKTEGGNGNPFDRASDPSVAFDLAHNVWLIASLPLLNSGGQTPALIVSRSADGLTWDNPVSVDPKSPSSDKDWITCDNSLSSPFFGHCYAEWDNPAAGDQILMSTSTDGGLTWGPALSTANRSSGIGGQPLVQPNGTVIVPIEGGFSSAIVAFRSTNGGTSWSSPVTVSRITDHLDAGGIRSSPLPSAALDAGGTIYVVWEDCRFRSGCPANDLVFSTSADGVKWSPVSRVPIDPTTSTVDHFIPGVGIDPNTSGNTAHLGLTYYFYPKSKCTTATCQLFAGFISSANGGATWNSPVTLAGPMNLNWLPNTMNGLMVGDYIATSFSNGLAHGVFAVASAKSASTFHESMFTNTAGLTIAENGPQLSSAGEQPVPDAHSDHGPRREHDERVPPRLSALKRARR